MNWMAVAAGGAIGASLRYALAMSLAQFDVRFPLATFLANILGCLLMGIGFVLIVEKALLSDVWRHLLMVGFLGAFTTFSTFSIETLSLIKDELYHVALLYVIASVLVSLLSASCGVSIAKNFF